MQITNLSQLLDALPFVEGMNLKEFLGPLLRYDKKRLEKWIGPFDEVLKAKVMLLAKKKNLIEELEETYSTYGKVETFCYSLPCKQEGDE